MAVARHESIEDAFENKCSQCGHCFNGEKCPKCNGEMQPIEISVDMHKKSDEK